MSNNMRLCRVLSILALSSMGCLAQLNTGSITGTVKDPTGAVVPNAKVTVTDVSKGLPYNSVTDANGLFSIRALPAATYTERVEVPGFATYERPGIVLEVGGHVAADVNLSVAQAGQTVTVNESAGPMLQTDDATTGQTINRTFINNLPLIGRQVFDLAFLAPGVAPATGSAFGAGNTQANNFTSDGSRNAQADILIDGVTTTNYDQNGGFVDPLFTPSVDAVQEFRVEQTNFSAEYGFTGGTVVNVVTRSGTNQFHGSAYEFWRNNILNANTFFNNKNGSPNPEYRWNDFGGTFGGPIKKDKLFFFGDYEGQRQIVPGSLSQGVPSSAERTGNFSELCTNAGGTFNGAGICSVQAGQLYDPYANLVSYNGGTFRTTPIPFNNLATYASPANGSPAGLAYAYQGQVLHGTGTALPTTMGIVPNVPGNLINPVAQKIINNYFPLPTTLPGSPGYNPYNNFYGTAKAFNNPNQFDIKLDWRLSDTDQLSIHEGTAFTNSLNGANVLGNVFDEQSAGVITGHTLTSAVNYTHTFNPTTVLTASAGYTYQYQDEPGLAASYPGFSPVTSLGLPSYMLSSGTVSAPLLEIGPYGEYGGQGWGTIVNGNDVMQLIASVAHTAGNHDLHFGGEFRVHRINYYQPSLPGGVFNFQPSGTSQIGTGIGGGDALASFLVGFPTGWSAYAIANQPATQNLQYAGFIQDNWHVNSKLTLNLGLRYDVDAPRTERLNHETYFNTNVPNPLEATGLLPTNSPCAACNQGNLLGSFEYTGLNGNPRTPYNTYWGAIGPRLGLAYKIGNNATLRTGWGVYYDPSKAGAAGAGSGQGGFLGYINQVNFTAYNSSDNVTPAANLSNPFPGGIAQPSGTYQYQLAGMPGGDAGSAPIRTWNVLPQEQSWSFGLQHQLPWSVLAEADYVGRKGTHLYAGGDTYSIDHIPASVQQAYINGGASYMNAYVPWPLAAAGQALTTQLGGGAYSNAFWNGTWQRYNQYLPYPQYPLNVWGSSGLQAIDPPWANSIYNALQVRVEKRFSAGLQALMTYTHSKSLDDASTSGSNEYLSSGALTGFAVPATIQDPNNLHLQRSYSNFDIPDVFQISWVYQLPFGKGKMYGSHWNGIVDGFLGGWQLNGSYRWDDGTPLILGLSGGTSAPTYNQGPNYPTQLQIAGNYGNTLQYFTNAAGAAAPATTTYTTASGATCYTDPWYPCQYADGNAPRTLNVRAPGTNNWTASLFKDFPLWNESSKLEFGIEGFNIFNHVQFAPPALTVGQANFGIITTQANQPRIFQLRAKLYF